MNAQRQQEEDGESKCSSRTVFILFREPLAIWSERMIRKKIGAITFECDEVTGKSRVTTENECITEDNPLIAWNIFWSRAGYQLGQELRDRLSEHGFDRYLGTRK